MKQYWETLKTFLDSVGPETKKSEIIEAWNAAVEAYNEDDDIIEIADAYAEAKEALGALFKSLVKLEYEAETFSADVQRKCHYAENDCSNNFLSINQFMDGKDKTRDRRGETTFNLARYYLYDYITELQAEGGCADLDPANF